MEKMERFRFGEQEGGNGFKMTRNGWLATFERGEHCYLEIAGPDGKVRSMVIIDKATAGKLGAALLKWADGEVMPVLARMIKEQEDRERG